MRPSTTRGLVLLEAVVLAVTLAPRVAAAQVGPGDSAEDLVRHLYDLVTFPADSTLDYDALRATLLPEAVIVLRTSRSAATVMSVDDFIADWVRFIEEYEILETGFVEDIRALVPFEFGDIAHVLVLYEASIPGHLEPHEGVDSIHLVRRDGRWWIAGILNEVPAPERPVPERLREAAG